MKSFRSLSIFLFVLLFLSIILVLLIPDKPLSIEQIYTPESPIDAQISIVFSHIMDEESVVENFSITPFTPGKISWSGKRFVYSFDEPLDFSTEYRIDLSSQIKTEREKYLVENWSATFITQEKSFYYISTNPIEGVIQQYVLETQNLINISSEEYVVESFQLNQNLQKMIVFAALRSEYNQGDFDFKPYILDINSQQIRPLKYFHNNDFQINFTKWIPFENSILVSATPINATKNYTDYAHTKLFILNLDNNNLEALISGYGATYEVYPTPDGRSLMYIDDGNLMMRDLHKEDGFLITSNFYEYFGFSQYGKYLVYSAADSSDQFSLSPTLILQSSNADTINLFDAESFTFDTVSLSLDENIILFRYQPSLTNIPFSQIATYDINEKKLSVITHENFFIREPQFSPKGDFISYLMLESTTSTLYPDVGWDDYEKKLFGGKIQLKNFQTEDVIDLDLYGYHIVFAS